MRGRRADGLLAALPSFLAIVLAAAPAAAFTFPDDVVTVPEPGTLVLLTTGAAALVGLGWLRRRK